MRWFHEPGGRNISVMQSHDISEEIVEDLYAEALVLADDVRAVFDLRLGAESTGSDDLLRVALSIEGLRTTTRVMHVLAWLLNQRAFYSGELSETQLRRHGALPQERTSDPDNIAMLEPETQALIRESEELHARAPGSIAPGENAMTTRMRRCRRCRVASPRLSPSAADQAAASARA